MVIREVFAFKIRNTYYIYNSSNPTHFSSVYEAKKDARTVPEQPPFVASGRPTITPNTQRNRYVVKAFPVPESACVNVEMW